MTAMRARQRGFTLIELMITVAIVGILASVAIPMYAQYMMKSKKTEAYVGIDAMMRNMVVYHQSRGKLPPSTNTMPAVSACASPTAKTPVTTQSAWFTDPGWAALEFHSPDPGYYQYTWTQTSATDGVAQARGDLDCDGVPGLLVVDVSISSGAVFETVTSDVLE